MYPGTDVCKEGNPLPQLPSTMKIRSKGNFYDGGDMKNKFLTPSPLHKPASLSPKPLLL